MSLQKAYSLMASAMGSLAEATERERQAETIRTSAASKYEEAKMLFLEAGMEAPPFDIAAKVEKTAVTRS